jgi:hypothetical protein
MSVAPEVHAMQAATIKPPITERINFRLLFFSLAMLLVIGYPIYIYLDNIISGGIHDLGNGMKKVDLKSMSSFVFDQTGGTISDVPEKWRALDGQRIVLEGEMVPPSLSARGGTGKFELVYSVQKCCFSGVPQIQHFIQCTVPSGAEVPFLAGLVRVAGTLRVDVTRDPETNAINGVFHLAVEGFEPVE